MDNYKVFSMRYADSYPTPQVQGHFVIYVCDASTLYTIYLSDDCILPFEFIAMRGVDTPRTFSKSA